MARFIRQHNVVLHFEPLGGVLLKSVVIVKLVSATFLLCCLLYSACKVAVTSLESVDEIIAESWSFQ